MNYQFVSGWDPQIAERGRQAFFAAGHRFFSGVQFQDDTRPLPPAFSLSSFIKWPYDQGPVGSCFANMGAHVLQLMMRATTLNHLFEVDLNHSPEEIDRLTQSLQDESPSSPFNPSRHMIWYQCRKLDGSLGSPQDGGSIVNSFMAIGDPPHGVGDCPEELAPYKPNHHHLEKRPSPEAFANADKTRIVNIAELSFHVEQWKRSIFNVDPPGIGIFWPSGWDTACDRYGRTTGIGSGGYGHAVTVIGWIDDWDGQRWWEILNSHGAIYGVPPADVQERIQGYQSTAGEKSFSFWAREDWFQDVLHRQHTELYNASDVRGYVPRPINVMPSFVGTRKW